MISVVVPVYNEEKNLLLLMDRLEAALRKTERAYEIIYVDDGSDDERERRGATLSGDADHDCPAGRVTLASQAQARAEASSVARSESSASSTARRASSTIASAPAPPR